MVLDEVVVDSTSHAGVFEVDDDEVEYWLRKRLDKMKDSILVHLESELQSHRYNNETAVKNITPSWYKTWWLKVP
jgi:hypothetical protein